MPTRPRSPVRSIHSWSFVYFSPGGYGMLRPLVKGHRHHPRPGPAAADVHLELGAWCGGFDRHVAHADRLFQIGRLRTAGDDSCLAAFDVDAVPLAGDP